MARLGALKRIVKWNEERNLIKTPGEFDLENETSFIVEELLEANTQMKSGTARKVAKLYTKFISGQTLCHKLIKGVKRTLGLKVFTPAKDQIVDALGDIIVFAVGGIRKLGYDPDLAMNEVLKEIESRKGKIIKGKFTKDKSPEAQAKWYKADFSKAEIKES